MYYKCCVRGCSSTRNDAILHRFPTNENRISLWLRCLNNEELEMSFLHNLFICEKHFEKRFIGLRSRLRMDAYPSLFTADEISAGIPHSRNETSNIGPLADHSYTRKRHHDHNYCKEESSSGISCSPVVRRKVLSEIQQNMEDGNAHHSSLNIADQPSTSRTNIPNTIFMQSSTEDADVNEIKATSAIGKPVPRKRLINKFQTLSPVAKRIYIEYKKSKNQANFHARAKRALKFSRVKAFKKLTDSVNPITKKFMAMQIKMCKRNKKGRRFSLDEKLIALAIMKQSPKCYRFLYKIFILPSITTLNKMVSKLNIGPGINTKLFQLIKKEVNKWQDNKKYCTVIFDEMALGMGLSYDHKKDHIQGFVNLQQRRPRYADHVLVIMVRGAVFKWQQPIAYYFCEGATSGPELKSIIKDVVTAINETGLKPLALGCDQGTAFQSAIKSLQEDTRRDQLINNVHPDDTITIGDCNINIIFDPSHLIKGVRNNFLNKNIDIEGKISKWQDIVDVYKTDCQHTESRLLHKLNDEHVIPEKIKKMKVKNCVRVLSKTTSAALSYTSQFSHYVDGTIVSETMKNTAETLIFFDDLFDSINGSCTSIKKCKGKPLKVAVQEGTRHMEFWRKAILKLENMKFVDENGQRKSVPTLKNFITTIKSYMKLWQIFKNLGLKIMRPRYFNTDPIENFFGQVRAYNYRNNDPTCHNFMNTFKSLTITRVIKFHSESFNCEDDPAEQLLNLQTLFSDEIVSTNLSSVPSVHPNAERNRNILTTIEQARRERLNTHSRAYTAGWVVRKIIEKVKCNECKKDLTTTADPTIHKWISQREYKDCKKKEKLSYPSEKVVRLFGTILTMTNEYLEHNAHSINLRKSIYANIVSKYSLNLVKCTEHQAIVAEYFSEIVIRFGINNWCNIINKILKGVDNIRLKNQDLPNFQALALEKFNKKLKNKSFNK